MNNLIKIVDQFQGKKVLVVGDIMLDWYTYGEVSRISPEAPVPVLKSTKDSYVLGGASNAVNNLSTLGAQVSLAGVVGDDSAGERVLNLLNSLDIDSSAVMKLAERPSTVKHRYVAGNQQLLRVDEEVIKNLLSDQEDILLEKILNKIDWCDGVVLSDYAKGLFSPSFTRKLIEAIKEKNKVIIADIKPENSASFLGVDYITPNLKEALEISRASNAQEAGLKIAKEMGSNVLLTMGSEGILSFNKEGEIKHLPTNKVRVYDVSGAGDTVVAAAFLAVLSGSNLVEAGQLANFAAELVVQKPGTATVSVDEIKALLTGGGNHISELNVVPKLWGYEKWLENNNKYCSKILVLNKGYQCSLHYHKNKDETFLILKGKVKTEVGPDILIMTPGNFVRVLPGVQHRFSGLEDSEILEVSTHHEESDSYRIEESRKT